MKKLNLILAVTFLGTSIFGTVNAQEKPLQNMNERSYWQISARGGYDFPIFKEDFKYIDYKGGIMGGFSINKYWDWFGVQLDGDFIKNTPTSTINSGKYLGSKGIEDYTSFATNKKDITRTFIGIGPAFKYQSTDNKFTTELGLLGGIGIIDGGEILITAKEQSGYEDLISYHSGFDKASVASAKAQLRANYFFNNNWGIHAGAYYMIHFNVPESQKNAILADYSGSNTPTYYYIEQGFNTGENAFNGEYNYRSSDDKNTVNNTTDQRQKLNLQSLGVFAGVSYRFGPKKQPEIVKKNPEIINYRLVVVAKDKYTGQVIPDTEIRIQDAQGNVVKTAITDSSGKVYFSEIIPNNYTIAGTYNGILFKENSAEKSEFIKNGNLTKEILYADRSFILKGKTFQCNSSVPLSDVAVYLENKFAAYKKSTISDPKGEFIMQLPEDATYELYGKKANYFSQVEMINAQNYNRDRNLFVKLEICAQETKCGEGIILQNILYDLDKSLIRKDAEQELNKVVRFMGDNPGITVELGSHTDSRGSDSYNLSLSQRRAQAAVDYIVSKGISRNKIIAKGYGESKLLNSCGNNSNCSEAEHQLNRRTEFKVICL